MWSENTLKFMAEAGGGVSDPSICTFLTQPWVRNRERMRPTEVIHQLLRGYED